MATPQASHSSVHEVLSDGCRTDYQTFLEDNWSSASTATQSPPTPELLQAFLFATWRFTSSAQWLLLVSTWTQHLLFYLILCSAVLWILCHTLNTLCYSEYSAVLRILRNTLNTSQYSYYPFWATVFWCLFSYLFSNKNGQHVPNFICLHDNNVFIRLFFVRMLKRKWPWFLLMMKRGTRAGLK